MEPDRVQGKLITARCRVRRLAITIGCEFRYHKPQLHFHDLRHEDG